MSSPEVSKFFKNGLSYSGDNNKSARSESILSAAKSQKSPGSLSNLIVHEAVFKAKGYLSSSIEVLKQKNSP